MDSAAVARQLQPDGTTSWGNLGYWGDAPGATSYASAARALAVELGRAAALETADDLLDVGVGAGDQLAIWQREFGVARITALEPDANACELARERVSAAAASGVVLEQAGAEHIEALPPARYDRVLALDCAYHFESRDRFFAAARARLRDGGCLALTDLIAGPRFGAAGNALRGLFGVRERLDDVESYRTRLAMAGFDDAEVSVWTRPVLAGFARHVAARPRLWARPDAAALAVGFTALAAAALSAGGVIDYVCVVARAGRPR